MQNVKPITALTNLLTKNNFEVKELQKNKSIVVLKKGYPRLYFEVLKKGYKVWSIKELTDRALMNGSGILEFINELNQFTCISKYYLHKSNALYVEATMWLPENETVFTATFNSLKHDMKQILANNKNSRKFIVS